MIKIIYDFDGTLTPYPIGNYPIFNSIQIDKEEILKSAAASKVSGSIYETFYNMFFALYKQKNIPLTKENIIRGANTLEFNKGVLDFFQNFATNERKVENYIVTSGIKDYVENTSISKYIKKIYGTEFKYDKEIATSVKKYVTDADKPNILNDIKGESKNTLIYIGDGITDKSAFEFIHNNYGYCLFVGEDDQDKKTYAVLKELNIVDEYFPKDFSENSKLRKYIEKIVNNLT